MSKGLKFIPTPVTNVRRQLLQDFRDLSFIRWGGGGGRAGANGGRVIIFYATKKGRVTKNLSRAFGRAISFFVNTAVHLK